MNRDAMHKFGLVMVVMSFLTLFVHFQKPWGDTTSLIVLFAMILPIVRGGTYLVAGNLRPQFRGLDRRILLALGASGRVGIHLLMWGALWFAFWYLRLYEDMGVPPELNSHVLFDAFLPILSAFIGLVLLIMRLGMFVPEM